MPEVRCVTGRFYCCFCASFTHQLFFLHTVVVLFVKGEQRIGFFASRNIPEQTELFFDYQYNRRIDNDIILKDLKGTKVSWMKDK
jgi:hypothetical protein